MLSTSELTWLKAQQVFEVVNIKQFDNALTNDVYLITDNRNISYIFKRLNTKARTLEDRKSEYLVQQLASQQALTPHVVAHNSLYKLQQFIQGSLVSENEPSIHKLLATQLHRIHALPAQYAPKQRLFIELQRLKKQLLVTINNAIFLEMSALAMQLDNDCACDTLCHGDLSINNVLQAEDGELYILDWEYAVIACGAYDLAFCICINKFSVSQSTALITEYYKHYAKCNEQSLKSLQEECDLYLKLFNYINELWALCFMD